MISEVNPSSPQLLGLHKGVCPVIVPRLKFGSCFVENLIFMIAYYQYYGWREFTTGSITEIASSEP